MKSKKEPRRNNLSNKLQVANQRLTILKNQNKQLKQQVEKYKILSKNPFNNKWNHVNEPGLFQSINNYHDNSLAEYVYGLFHPDAVYRENLNIKAPSVLPIPTSNFAFKETFTIVPNDKGNFVLAWNPNYLASSKAILKNTPGSWDQQSGFFSNVYYTNDPDLDGNSVARYWRGQVFKHITQDFNKYRLTSACLKVKYTGKKIDQAGMISACASFMEFPRTTVAHDTSQTPMPASYYIPDQFPQLQRLGDFDTIRQGQWAQTVSLVNEPDGLTCVYIPTDPLSQAFVDDGDTITAKNITTYSPAFPSNSLGTWWNSRAASISFDVCGYGIFNPDAVPLITVECFYNYEIIVNEDQMPFFRPTVSQLTNKQVQEIGSVVNKITSTSGTIVSTVKHEEPSIFAKISRAINQGLRYVDKFAPLVKLGSLII